MEEGVSERKYGRNEKNDEGKEAECPDDTPPDDMEEGVSDRKDDKNKNIDEEKETECLDDTPPVDMEEGVKDINDEGKNEGETIDSESTTIDEGKGVNN